MLFFLPPISSPSVLLLYKDQWISLRNNAKLIKFNFTLALPKKELLVCYEFLFRHCPSGSSDSDEHLLYQEFLFRLYFFTSSDFGLIPVLIIEEDYVVFFFLHSCFHRRSRKFWIYKPSTDVSDSNIFQILFTPSKHKFLYFLW